MTMEITKSIDHFMLEVTESSGIEMVSFRRYDKDGNITPGMDFMRGDKIAGAKILNQIGQVLGYGEVAKIEQEGKE